MKNKMKIIRINGFRGLALIALALGCLVSGFVLFPSWICMQVWNFFSQLFGGPSMTIGSGALLWVIIVLVILALNKQNSIINFGHASFCQSSKVNEKDMKLFLEKIKEANVVKPGEIEESDSVKK